MNKIIYFLIIVFISISFNSCTKKQVNINASYPYTSFDQLLEKSNIIALVKIKGKLRELNTELPRTVFKAELIETYKNNIDKEINEVEVAQVGHGNALVNGIPQFKNGEIALLFLNKTEFAQEKQGEVFIIVGNTAGMFRQSDLESDLFERYEFNTNTLSDTLENVEELKQKYKIDEHHSAIYRKDKLVKKIKDSIEQKGVK